MTGTFLSLLRRTIDIPKKNARPSHMAVIFDPPGATSNHLLSKEYKANRVYDFEEGESPFFHLPFIKKALKFLGIRTIERKKVEADDVIASIATRFVNDHPTHHTYITSTDSDFYQLLSPRIQQIVLGREGAVSVMNHRHVHERLGVTPQEYVYFKSLVGDHADNIRGVPGIGKVRARDIIKNELEFDPAPHRDILDLNQKLITLNCNVRIGCDWNDFAFDRAALATPNKVIFEKLKF